MGAYDVVFIGYPIWHGQAAGNGDVSSFDLASGQNGKAPTVTLNSGYE